MRTPLRLLSQMPSAVPALGAATMVMVTWAGVLGRSALEPGPLLAMAVTALLAAALAVGLWRASRAAGGDNSDVRLQEAQLFGVVDRLPWALLMFEKGHIVYANPAARRFLEADEAASLAGRSPADFVVPEDRGAVEAWLADAGSGQTPPPLNVRMVRAGGSQRHVRAVGAWVVYGDRSMFEIQLADRTSEHRAQAEAEHLASFLRLAPEPIVEVQHDGTVSFLNDAARKILPDLEADGAAHPYLDCLKALRVELQEGARVAYRTCRVEAHVYDQTAFLVPGGEAVLIYGRDVTRREEAKRALRVSEDRFDLLFRISPVGMSISRVRDGRFLEVNDSFARLLGYTSSEEVIGRTSVEVGIWASEQMRQRIVELLQRVQRTLPRVITVRTRDGRVRHVLGASELIDFNGEPCIAGMLLDIEERERLRAEVEAERDFARSVIDTVGQGLLISDAHYRVQYVNPALLRMTGYTQEEVMNATPIDFLHPEDRARVLAGRTRRRKGGSGDRYDARVRRKDGTYLDALVAIVPRLAGGEYVGTTTVVVDVTEQKQANREIERLRHFYEDVLHHLPLDVAVIDAQGRYHFINQHAVPDPETRALLMGKRSVDYARLRGRDPEPFTQRQAWIDRVIETKQGAELEEVFETPDGRRYLLRAMRPVLDATGEVAYLVGYAMDVTARKHYEAGLIRARDQAEELSTLKSNFIANMSHEVRTPLTAVIGFAEVLQEELEQPHLRELAVLIRESGARLLETLNSVLDLARMEAGAVELRLDAIDLVPLTRTTLNLFRPLARAKHLTLESDLPEEPMRALVDGPAFNRIMNNLLSNAIKFTEQGGVRVEMKHEGEFVVVRVVDTGVGIDPAFMGQVFDEFRQESAGLARSHTGSGLGLAIVKRLVEMMNGTVAVESTKGSGTAVTVTLPAIT